MATSYLNAAPVQPASAETDVTPCPAWCTVRHYPGGGLDAGHRGEFADLDMPRVDSPTETALYAYLTVDESRRSPRLFVEDGLGGARMDRASALAFVRNLRSFAAEIEAAAGDLTEGGAR